MSNLYPVEVRGLVKRYGDVAAVDRVDMTVEAGDIYGYLGPNGAGKTTTLRMLLGLIRRDSGTIRLFGRDPAEGIEALAPVSGFVESPAFYPYLSGRENLRLLGALDGGATRGRIDEVLDQVNLLSRAGDRVGTYSLGMRQRLGIASSLMRSPKLLVLDEPANGLDPAGIRDLRELVAGLPEQGIRSSTRATCSPRSKRSATASRSSTTARSRSRGGSTSCGPPTARPTGSRAPTSSARSRSRTRSARRAHGSSRTCSGSTRAARSSTGSTVELGRAGVPIRYLAREQRSLEDLFFRLTEQAA